MRLFLSKLTPSTKITVEEAENLTGKTIRDLHRGLISDLAPACPEPWAKFAYDGADEYGFFRVSHPADSDIEGYAAGRPGQIPLLLAILLQDIRTFETNSALSTLLSQKGLHRYFMAIQYEGRLLRRAAWHEEVNLTQANPVQARLLQLHRVMDKLLAPVAHGVDGMQVAGMLAYGVTAQYPRAAVQVLCCSLEQANYWGTGPYASVGKSAQALVNDLLERAGRTLANAGVEVIEGKWLELPGYEPLFDSRDICDF